MSIRSTLVFASLAMPLMAQDADVTAASTQGAAAIFYQAYFLDNDQASNKAASAKALALYTKFLSANPTHELAGKAASRAVIILYSTGDFDRARAFSKQHADLITGAEKAREAARSNRGGGDQEVSAKLIEAMQTAREDGNDAESRRLMAALRRAGGSTRGRGGRGSRGGFGRGGGRAGQGGGRGGFGGGRGGQGGGRGNRGSRGVSIPKITEMNKADAQKAVEDLVTGMERMIDFMAQRGQAEQADKLEAKLDKIQDLVDDGKLADAQKILDTLEAEMGSIGGRGRGGDAGRRRGGDAGGAGGERRRRRGGDGGDAGGTGERRRRRG